MKKLSKKFTVNMCLLLALCMMLGNVTLAQAVEKLDNGVVKSSVDEHDKGQAHGEAPEGMEWKCIYHEGYVNYENLICTQEEHTHASATAEDCQGWVLTCEETEHTHADATEDDCLGWKITCTQEEHTHASATADDCQGWVQTCTQDEHTHASATVDDCQGWVFVCSLEEHNHRLLNCGIGGWRCNKTEHTHSAYAGACYTQKTCGETEHTHSVYAGCYTQKTCVIPEHTHSAYAGGCYTQNSCDKTEHTHSEYAGACYTQNSCEKEEHAHIDACYEYVEPYYTCELVEKEEAGDSTNGNERITIEIMATDDAGKPISGARVTIYAHDRNSHAETPKLTKNTLTDSNGIAEFKISSTYDYLDSYTIESAGFNTVAITVNEAIGLEALKYHLTKTGKLSKAVYTVNFYNSDKTLLKSQEVTAFESATAPTGFECPACLTEDACECEFSGWDTNSWKYVTGNLEVTAQYAHKEHQLSEVKVITEAAIGQCGWSGQTCKNCEKVFNLEEIHAYTVETAKFFVVKDESLARKEDPGVRKEIQNMNSNNYVQAGIGSFNYTFRDDLEDGPANQYKGNTEEYLVNDKTPTGDVKYEDNFYKYEASLENADWYVIKKCTDGWHVDGVVSWTKTAKEFNISYEGLEGAVNSNPTKYSADAVVSFVAPGEREGYKFAGWKLGEESIFSTSGKSGELTVTAEWTEREVGNVNVTFVSGEEDAEPVVLALHYYTDSASSASIAATDIPVPAEKSGYTFKAWMLGDTEYTVDQIAAMKFGVDTTFVAAYTQNSTPGNNNPGVIVIPPVVPTTPTVENPTGDDEVVDDDVVIDDTTPENPTEELDLGDEEGTPEGSAVVEDEKGSDEKASDDQNSDDKSISDENPADDEMTLDIADDEVAQGAAVESADEDGEQADTASSLAQTGTASVYLFYVIAAAFLVLAFYLKKSFVRKEN